jgi:YVTN family beta-propeller protein
MRHPLASVGFISIGAILFSANVGFGALGTLEKTFNFNVGDMVANPDLPYVYATIPATDSLAIINSQTLAIAATVQLGISPRGIAVSPDGSKLYISNSGTSVLVLNTGTNALTTSVPVGISTTSVAVGSNNRIWVLDPGGVEQFNASTGASTGPDASGVLLYSGAVLTSPDGNSLYYATYGLSPGDLYKFNVTNAASPTLVYHNGADIGENGEDLVLSNDGSELAYVCGYGNGGYQIPEFRTSDMSIVTNFATGAYPDALAFSPDGKTVYALHTVYPTSIDVDNAATGASTAQFPAADRGGCEVVDNSGQDLFVAYSGTYFNDTTLKVYSVPEPASCSIVIMASTALSVRRRRLR